MPPPDVFAEAPGLKRRRALLEALQQRAMAPNIQGTPGQGIAQLLASLGTSYFSGQGLDQIDQREAQLGQQRQVDLASELEAFMRKARGQPGMHELPPDMPGPQVPEVPGDPQAAVLSAMTSRFPEMQGIGQAMLPGMLKQDKPVAPNDWKVDERTGRIYRTNPKTGVLEFNDQSLDRPPKDPLVKVLNYPEVGQGALEDEVKSLQPGGAEYKEGRGAAINLQTTAEAMAAFGSGAKTGIFADFFQGARKAAKALGLDVETAANDQLGALLAQRVLAISAERPLAGQMSDADLKFLRESTASTQTDPVALRRILALSAAQSFNQLRRYNAGIESIANQDPSLSFLMRHQFPMNFDAPDEDDEFRQMFENALAGKPTISGGVTVPRPAPTAAPRPPASGITYTPRGGR